MAIACLGLGCGSDGAETGAPGAASTGGAQCPEGQAVATGADGIERCAPALAEDCAPGTMPRIGSAACEPVGWHDCPAGFVADPSGWGCADVLPAEPCQGATREALGQASCVPIGDCDVPFPPGDAALHVDPAFVGDVDPTHFDTIGAALAAAEDGDVIAIDSGSYGENLMVAADVTLVGRCAAEVEVTAPIASQPAIRVQSGTTLAARGITVRGGSPGFSVPGSAVLSLDEVLIEGAEDEGIRAPGGEVTVQRSVVRGTVPSAPGSQTLGVMAYDGAVVAIHDSALTENIEAGLGIIDAGTELTLEDSVIRATQPQPNGDGGIAAKAFDGSRLVLRRSALVGNRQVALMVGGPGTTALAAQTIARDLVIDDRFEGGFAWGVVVRLGAEVDLEDFALVRTPVIGLSVEGGSALRGTRVVVRDGQGIGWLGVGFAGLAGQGDQLALTDSALIGNVGGEVLSIDAPSLVRLERVLMHGTHGTGPSPQWPAGRGGTGVVVAQGGRGEVVDSALTDGAEVGLGVVDAGSTLDATRVLVSGMAPNIGDLYGHGFLATNGARGLIDGCWFRQNEGIALAFAASAGSVRGTFLSGNTVGVHVQGGVTLREDDPSTAPAGELELVLSPDTVFWDNGERLGSGELPLPDPIAEVPPL
ncbi:MAG: right-handed parallel beta-helix repeat-containing protein [Polyangiaceae bacterium]